MRYRKGGTLANGIFLILFLLVFFTVLQHISPIVTSVGTSSSTGSVPSPGRGSCTAEQVSGAAVPASPKAAPAAMMASSPYVILLPVSTSSGTDKELLNNTWWQEVFSSSAQTFADMPQGLYWGFLNDSQSMQDWIIQSVPNPPPWTNAGAMSAVRVQLDAVKSNATISGNSTLARNSVRDFVLGLSGDGLAFLDQFTGGSLSALKTYQETHDPYLALCQTFPGQMAQLYDNAFDPNIPADQRARYLGELLMVGGLTVVLAGHDHFDAKFKTALKNANLLDVWPQTKALLVDVATKVSSNAAGLTLQAMSKIAARFPTSPWAAGYTGFRIESMVEVLSDAGKPKESIEQKLSGLAQAADGAGDPEAVGDAADASSYDDGHAIKLYVTGANRGYLYTDVNTMRQMKASFLAERVPGFTVGKTSFLNVRYLEAGKTYYHYYTGGEFWNPTLPDGLAKKGDVVSITVRVLTRDDFANSIPQIDFPNDKGLPYLGDITRMTDHSLVGDLYTLRFTEDPPIEMNMGFAVTGKLAPSMGWNSGSGPFLDMYLTPDVFNDALTLRIYYDGYHPASFGLMSGSEFQDVYDISNDGVRLRVTYNSGGFLRTSTTYPVYDPSVLYRLSLMRQFTLPYNVAGYSRSFIIDNVGTARILEHTMAYNGKMNDVARIGAEVAYGVSTGPLGLKDVIMNDPAEGGSDLYTPEHKVVIEARMLQRTLHEPSDVVTKDVTDQLRDLVGRLDSDFRYYRGQGLSPTAGYAILTYISDQDTIKTVVLEVLPR